MKTILFTLRKIPVVLILLSLGIIVSCKEEPKKNTKVLNPEASTSTKTVPVEDNATEAEGTVALNPPHGQPGHRCDIAVGAPLNSAPVNNGTNAQSGVPAKNSEGVALNPPHGQPGHRCDIKVGEPL